MADEKEILEDPQLAKVLGGTIYQRVDAPELVYGTKYLAGFEEGGHLWYFPCATCGTPRQTADGLVGWCCNCNADSNGISVEIWNGTREELIAATR